MRVVFVCTGNTCRSPMAAALFRDRVERHPKLRELEFTVESAGLSATSGAPISPGAERALAKVGLSAAGHGSQPFTERFKEFDLILTMTEAHKAQVLLNYPEAARNVYTLKEYAGLDGGPDIQDPFGQDDAAYEACLEEIARAVQKAVERLSEELGGEAEEDGDE